MKRLERLSRLSGYTVDRHQIDPRGWDIVSPDRRPIGEVRDLIVDTATMKAVYLDVELDGKLFDLGGDPHVLIPLERAEGEDKHKHLLVPSLDYVRLQELLAERDLRYYEFWNTWWQRGQTAAGPSSSPTVSQQLSTDDLQRALDNVRPGEHVRIPIVNEEIIIERRPLHRDEQDVARVAGDQPVVTQNVK